MTVYPIDKEFEEIFWNDPSGCPQCGFCSHTVRYEEDRPVPRRFIVWCAECGSVINEGFLTDFSSLLAKGIQEMMFV